MARKGGKIQMTNREVALKFDCTSINQPVIILLGGLLTDQIFVDCLYKK